MDELLTSCGQIAWAQCWQMTLLIAVVWLVLRVVGRNRPHLACALWIVVLVKCVTPPLVSSPSGIFCWLQRADREALRYQGDVLADAHSLPAADYTSASAAATQDPDAVVVQLASAAPLPTAAPAFAPADAPIAAGETVTNASWSLPSLLWLAAGGWLAGTFAFGVAASVRWLACWRKWRAAQQGGDPTLERLLDDLRRRLAVRRRIRLLVSDSSLGPAVVGLWRPTVILPAVIVRGKSPAELEPLLAHELIHVRRGDLWIGLLQTLALGLWWFHPLVRLASRLITREAERCCDEEVIAHLGCDPAAYARSLLDVLALKQQLIPIPAFPGVRPVDVTSQRLERIMKLGQGCHKRTPWWCWLAMFLLAAAALPGAAFVAGAKEKPKPAPQDPKRYIHADFPPPTEEAVGKPDELTTRTYEVADLVAALQQRPEGTENESRLLLGQLVQSAAPGPWETAERLGVDFGDAPADPKHVREPMLVSDETKRLLGWSEGKLLVRQTTDGHRRIEQQLAVLREHGYAEIDVEVRIISGPAVVLNAEGIDWRMIGDSELDGGQPLVEEQARGGYLSPAGTLQVRIVDSEESNRSKLRGTSESVVQRHVPAMLALVDNKKATELLATAQADRKTSVIQAPKVMLFNGQSARVQDVTQRPFVVGMTPAPEGDKVAIQPKIRVVSEGTIIRVRPVAQKDGPIRLDFGLTLSGIRDVETAEFPVGPGKNPITVQVPEVASTRLNTTVEMNADQTLVLSLPKTAKGKKEQQPMCVLVKVRKITGGAATAETKSSAQVAIPAEELTQVARQPREQFACETSGWQFKFTPTKGGVLNVEQADEKNPLADVRIRGAVKLEAVAEKQGDQKPDRITAEFESARITSHAATADAPARLQIALDGNVRLTTHDGMRFEAKAVNLQFDDPFVPKFTPGRKPAKIRMQVNDARSIEYGLRGKQYLPEGIHYQYFSPGPVKAEAVFIDKVYPVADLVIPVPTGPIKISPSGAQVKRESPALDKPEFDTLIDLITTTIRPDSWESVGGQGRISTATNSLSLVIRQEERAHQQIAGLLVQLRHLQDIQVVLSLERLEVSTAELERVAAKELESPLRVLAQNPRSRAWCLKPEAISSLKRLPSAKAQSGPNITTFNGQSVDLRLAEGEQQATTLLSGLLIQPMVTADFRSLRLEIFGDLPPQTAQQPGTAGDKPRPTADLASSKESNARKLPMELRELALGQMLLVDVSQFAWQERDKGVAVLDKVPYTARLFKNVSAQKADVTHFYVITPQVLVVTEEEDERVLVPRKD